MRYGILLLLFFVGGCEADLETIPPAYASETKYESWTCERLLKEQD